MNGSDGGTNENLLSRLQVEATLAQRFIKAIKNRMKQLVVTSAQDFKLSSQHERKVLMDVAASNLLEGAVAGLVTFWLLRRIPYFKRRVVLNIFKIPYYPVAPQQPTFKSICYAIALVIFDGYISISAARFVFERNPDKFLEQLSDLPLMEGESVVSKRLCPILLKELQMIHADLAPEISDMNKVIVRDAIANPQTPLLQCYMKFCTNCRRRAAYEQILREQSGSSDAVIRIPPPGVPPNMSLSPIDTNPLSTQMTTVDMFDDSNFADDTTEDMFNDSNFEDDTTSSTTSSDWTETFVTDQEDDRRK
jgi:hypothetical protein